MAIGSLLVIAAYFYHCEAFAVVQGDVLNERPIVGILSQELSLRVHSMFPKENYTSYISASFVKDVEKSGARVVPILIGRDRSYYRNILRKINGVIFPGGVSKFNNTNGYADAAKHIYELAQELNDAGDYFPIFGTCLGFQFLVVLTSGRGPEAIRIKCRSYENLPLNFTQDFRKSRMFHEAPKDIIRILKNKDVTVNSHGFCIVDESLKYHNLTKYWRPTSYSNDEYGVRFIASIEHKRYPFYGVQFHPEKASFDWKSSKHYTHSFVAVRTNRYFVDFFVNECRKSQHFFANAAEENAYLIYNYAPKFTGAMGSSYFQCYMFEPRGNV
ncbi:gamma-glutamyl hydrolase A [Bicyclus anynana]|uniref:folate gamma-glutamyl hydrolase n=1 Tax=Bicyclus anynana TaxID=110368 RepID=A0ABM3LSS1_BICAN|nr:gamma-glutamyl hydrolase A [Bicyclus anynana]